jgi:hypothetical protein
MEVENMPNKEWKNSKSQAPNHKQIQISKFKTTLSLEKKALPKKLIFLVKVFACKKVCFEHWDFGIWYYLGFGIYKEVAYANHRITEY